MLARSTWWKEGPKSKVPWDIQVWFFVIIEVHGIDCNSLVLILLIYLWERKKLVHLFYPHFLDVYLLSILTILKTAKVVPVFKKGSKLDCSNYCPISLLSNVEKTLEKLMINESIIFYLKTILFMTCNLV